MNVFIILTLLKKFEQVMNKLLEDEKITALDFYVIMCALNYDLEQEHKNDSFLCFTPIS